MKGKYISCEMIVSQHYMVPFIFSFRVVIFL